MFREKTFAFIASVLVIAGPVSQPVMAATKEKIFGISLGPGGVPRCSVSRVRTTDFRKRPIWVNRWNYPQGWDANSPFIRSPDARSREVPYACFMPFDLFYSGTPDDRSYRPPPPDQFEEVKVLWPTAQAPTLPGITGVSRGQPVLTGYTLNGALETLYVYTSGLAVQNQMIDTLTKRFGPPQSRTSSQIVSSGGEKETSQNAIWVTDELYITFQGITEGRRTRRNLFGLGRIIIRTHKGQQFHERDVRSNEARTNF